MRKLLFLLCLSLSVNSWAGINFDNVDDILTCGSAANLDDETAFTASAWFFADTFDAEDAIVYKMVSGGTDGFFFFVNTAGALGCGRDRATSDAYSQSSDGAVVTGAWQFVSCSWNSTTAPDIYVGSLTASVAEVSYASESAGSGALVTEASGNLSIGNRDTVGSEQPFDGIIDEVCVFNAKLAIGPIQQIGNSRVRRMCEQVSTSLVLYASLDDQPNGTSGDGDTFYDRSGNTSNCTGSDGANNANLTMVAGFLTYP